MIQSKANLNIEFIKVKKYLARAIYSRPFKASELQILLCLMEHTYGNPERVKGKLTGRQMDRAHMSYEEFAEELGLSESTVRRAFKKLIDLNVITRYEKGGGRGGKVSVFGIQSNDDLWGIKPRNTVHTCTVLKKNTSHMCTVFRSKMNTISVQNEHYSGPNCTVLNAEPVENTEVAANLEVLRRSKKTLEGVGEVGEVVRERVNLSDLTNPKRVRKMVLSDEETMSLAGRFLSKNFSVILSPVETERLKLYLSDDMPNGYKLAILILVAQSLITERAEKRARGEGRFISRRPAEKVIQAAAERLAHNKLRVERSNK